MIKEEECHTTKKMVLNSNIYLTCSKIFLIVLSSLVSFVVMQSWSIVTFYIFLYVFGSVRFPPPLGSRVNWLYIFSRTLVYQWKREIRLESTIFFYYYFRLVEGLIKKKAQVARQTDFTPPISLFLSIK